MVNKIKEIRERLGLTQWQFSEKMGIPIGTIRHWEQGYRECPPYVVTLLEKLVDIELCLKVKENVTAIDVIRRVRTIIKRKN